MHLYIAASQRLFYQPGCGKDYLHLNQVILLAFVDVDLFPEKRSYKSAHFTRDKKRLEHDLDKMSFTFVELGKFAAHNTKPLEKRTLEEKV